MNKKTIMTTMTRLLQAAMNLLGLAILLAVVKEFFLQNLAQHPVATFGLVALLGLALLMGSRDRRRTMLHVAHHVVNWDQLLLDEPEEERLMKLRELKLGEAGSMDLWR